MWTRFSSRTEDSDKARIYDDRPYMAIYVEASEREARNVLTNTLGPVPVTRTEKASCGCCSTTIYGAEAELFDTLEDATLQARTRKDLNKATVEVLALSRYKLGSDMLIIPEDDIMPSDRLLKKRT